MPFLIFSCAALIRFPRSLVLPFRSSLQFRSRIALRPPTTSVCEAQEREVEA